MRKHEATVLPMKEAEYKEGPEALEQFERSMTALFQVPKPGFKKAKKKRPGDQGHCFGPAEGGRSLRNSGRRRRDQMSNTLKARGGFSSISKFKATLCTGMPPTVQPSRAP